MKERKKIYTAGIMLIVLAMVSGCYIVNSEDAALYLDVNAMVRGESRAPLPGSVLGIRLVITGPGMEVIDKYFPPGLMAVSVGVPAGRDRVISVALDIDPADPGAVLAFGDKVATDLKPGQVKVVAVRMKPVKTKLVVPDYIGTTGDEYGRVIQFDNIGGGGRVELYGTAIGMASDYYFKPHDIAFDRGGRIYIANNYASTGYGRVVRIDNILGAAPVFYPDTGFGIVAVAVDMERSLVYYTSGINLFSSPIRENTVVLPLSTTGIGQIRGIDIDDNGFLYIAGTPQAGGYGIFYYNPFTMNIVDQVTDAMVGQLNTPWDTLVRNDRIYVSNLNGADGSKILLFDKYLSFIDGYGNTAAGIDISQGMFYGPYMFVAILNKKITVIDDTFGMNKIVSMDDINGTGWQTNPSTAVDGRAFFNFYEC
ncbi:MAG: hypothetical protein JW881_11985 [Spirochaetales bacterium]|nr:hypothetical protein [Spirochaetales bacterium]